MDYLLEVKELTKYFPLFKGAFKRHAGWVKALDGVSFNLKQAGVLGIVGKSGSGKTTLAKLLVRLVEPTSGQIIYNPVQITNFRKDVQIIFQNPYQSLNPRMRLFDIVSEPLRIHHLARRQVLRHLVEESLKEVGLDGDILQRLPIEFSGGQRQKICLARALIARPKVLILDEAVSSLDLTHQVEIIDLLKGLKQKFALTYLFITHNLALLREFADSILVLENGRISKVIDLSAGQN